MEIYILIPECECATVLAESNTPPTPQTLIIRMYPPTQNAGVWDVTSPSNWHRLWFRLVIDYKFKLLVMTYMHVHWYTIVVCVLLCSCFLLSSGSMGCICLHLKIAFRSCTRGRQWCGIFHYFWWTASIKQRLLFSLWRLSATWGLSLFSVVPSFKCFQSYCCHKSTITKRYLAIAVSYIEQKWSFLSLLWIWCFEVFPMLWFF